MWSLFPLDVARTINRRMTRRRTLDSMRIKWENRLRIPPEAPETDWDAVAMEWQFL